MAYQGYISTECLLKPAGGEEQVSGTKEIKITLSNASLHMMKVINNREIHFRHHSSCRHPSVWCEQEWLLPSAEGWSFPTWQPGPVSSGNRPQPWRNLENSHLA